MTNKGNLARRTVMALLALVAGFLMLRHFENSQVYHPSRTMDASGAELGRPFEDVTLTTGDAVQLNGWFFPAATNSPRRQLVFLLCHGNAGNISHRLETCGAFLETGANVFVFDYRGYGRSQGKPSEEGTYLDGQAACAWLRRKGFAGKDLLLFGESLGGAVAAELALREQVGGLILQSTFTSIPDIGAELFPWLPVRWLSRIKYDTLAKLPRIRLPVLVMHSRSDGLIGFHHSERNYAAANEPKVFWEINGGHNDLLEDPKRFIQGLEQFILKLENASIIAAPPDRRDP